MIIRGYELFINETGGDRSELLTQRGRAELLADRVVQSAALVGRYDVVAAVWAIVDDGSFVVYRTEATEHGILETRLRARLRHPRVTDKQRRLLEAMHAADRDGRAAAESQLRRAIGRYATNTITACLEREWITVAEQRPDFYLLTAVGRSIELAPDPTPGDCT